MTLQGLARLGDCKEQSGLQSPNAEAQEAISLLEEAISAAKVRSSALQTESVDPTFRRVLAELESSSARTGDASEPLVTHFKVLHAIQNDVVTLRQRQDRD